LRQWAYRGQEFFSTGLYELAKSCFERAGQDKEATIADAYHHMTQARTLEGTSQATKNAFIKAAEKMKSCAQSEKSTHTAATLWYHAATCFEAAQEAAQASQAYYRGGFYDRAALISFDSQDMDACLHILASHSKDMDKTLVERIKEVSSVHYLRERKYRYVQSYYITLSLISLIDLTLMPSLLQIHHTRQLQTLFNGSLSECIQLARSLRFSVQLKELLQMNRQFGDLATAYLEEGLPVEAVRCLLQNFGDNSAIEWSRNVISTYLWTNFGFKATLNKRSIEEGRELIKIYSSLSGLLDPSGRHDVSTFNSLVICWRLISTLLDQDIFCNH
jgi:hypothetical protein